MSDAKIQYGPYRDRFVERILSDVDDFLSRNRHWKEIALLKAAGLDHRLLQRLRNGDSFRTDSVERLGEFMTRAARGEVSPDEFRTTKPKQEESHV